MTNLTTKKKDLFVQVLRAIAVFSVLIVHTTGYFTSLEFGYMQIVYAFLDSIANIAVPLFVFVSGYVLTKVYAKGISYPWYYKKRALRIFPAYIFFTTFYFMFFNYQDLAFKKFLHSMLFADASYHLPYVLLIFQLYLLFPLLLKINDTKLLIGSFLVQLVSLLFNSSNILIFPSFLFYFVLGIYTSKTNINLLSKLRIPSNVVIPLILACLVTYFWIKGSLIFGGFRLIPESYSWKADITRYFLYIYLIVFIFFSRENFMRFFKKAQHFIVKVGNYSFGIYLIHVFYLTLIIRLIFDNQYGHPLFVVFSLTATFLLSYLSLEVYNKLKDGIKTRVNFRFKLF